MMQNLAQPLNLQNLGSSFNSEMMNANADQRLLNLGGLWNTQDMPLNAPPPLQNLGSSFNSEMMNANADSRLQNLELQMQSIMPSPLLQNLKAFAPPPLQLQQLTQPGVFKTTMDVVGFIQNLLKELITDSDFTHIEQCLTGENHIQAEITEAVKFFMQKNVQGIVSGIKIIGQVIAELPTELQTCKGMTTDLHRIQRWATVFKHPVVLAKMIGMNVFKNFSDIMGETSLIVKDAQNHDFADMGTNVGKIVADVIGPIPKSTEGKMDTTDHQNMLMQNLNMAEQQMILLI